MVVENSKELRAQLESHKSAVQEQLSQSVGQAVPESGAASSETWQVPTILEAQPTPLQQPQIFSVHTAQSDADKTAAADMLATTLLAAPEGQDFLIKDGYSKEQVLNWYEKQSHPDLQYRTKSSAQPSERTYTTQSEFGRMMGRVDIPTWNGQRDSLQQCKLDVKVLESNISLQDRHLIANRLIEKFTGTAKKYLMVEPELVGSTKFNTADGHWQLIEHMRKSLGITDQDESHRHFKNYFYDMHRKSGESFLQYMNREEQAYRELQSSLASVDASQSPDVSTQSVKFFIPDKLRGWFFLERSGLAPKDKSHLLLQVGEYDFPKLKALIQKVYPQSTISKIDGQSYTAPKLSKNNYTEHEQVQSHDDDSQYEDDYEYSDAQSEWDDWYSLDDDDDQYQQCESFVDDEGYFYGTEAAIDLASASIAEYDPEYEAVLVTYTDARDLLKKAQVARQFYPVVVPVGFTDRKGKGKGKGERSSGKGRKSKGAGKSSSQPRPARGTGKGKGRKGKGRGRVIVKPAGKTGASESSEPLCFKCGEPGHFAKECPKSTDSPLKRARMHILNEEEEETYVFNSLEVDWKEMDPSELYCSQCEVDYEEQIQVLKCQDKTHDHSQSWKTTRQQKEEQLLAVDAKEHRGCALIDSGATKGVSSEYSMTQLIMDCKGKEAKTIVDYNLSESKMGFVVGSGKVIRSQFKTELKGLPGTVLSEDRGYPVHVVSGDDNNHSPIIIGVNFLKQNKVVIDYDTGRMFYKEDPHTVYQLKQGKNGYLYVPLSPTQCEEHLKVMTVTAEELHHMFTTPSSE